MSISSDAAVLEPAAGEPSADTATATATAPNAASTPNSTEGMALPVWFFGFEAVFASAYDLVKAFPQTGLLLAVAAVANIVVSLTVLRTRLRMARALWRGKGTRKVAFGLLALRLGSHFALAAVGLGVTSVAGHLAFAAAMAVITVVLMAYTQRVALRALAEGEKAV